MNNILFTLKYFDLFDYPLTQAELKSYLFKSNNTDNQAGPRDLIKENIIQTKDDLYFLPNREKILEIRKNRRKISLKKINKARRIARLLGIIPSIKMICICSNLGYLNADNPADIDLFIVTAKNRIWSARFWSVFLMKILNQRPSPSNMKDKICLSYFTTEDNLNLEHTKVGGIDTHLIYLLSQYLPIYIESNLWQKFIDSNIWINKFLPNFRYTDQHLKYIIQPKLIWLKNILRTIQSNFEEKLYKKIQLKIFPAELKQMMNRGDNKVIITDNMLKLHSNDKREEYNEVILGFYK